MGNVEEADKLYGDITVPPGAYAYVHTHDPLQHPYYFNVYCH